MKQFFGDTGNNKGPSGDSGSSDNGNNNLLLFILLAIVLASTIPKSTKPYRKYQMVLIAVIAGLILYTYTKKRFGGDMRTNTIEGNAANTTEVLLVINMSTSALTWATSSSVGGNTWRTYTPAALNSVKSIASGSYQLFAYDPNFSVETFFSDSNTNYQNNNADLAYVIYDLTTQTVNGVSKYTMYIAFASVNNCPGCSALIEALNRGPSGAGYTMLCEKPKHNNTRFEFEDGAGGAVTYLTAACPAGSTSPNIVYYNALPTSVTYNNGTVVFKKHYPTTAPFTTVSLARGASIAMSSLYSIGADIVTEGEPKAPEFSSPPESDITYVYNRYRGLLIESVSPTSSISSSNKRTVKYRSIHPL